MRLRPKRWGKRTATEKMAGPPAPSENPGKMRQRARRRAAEGSAKRARMEATLAWLQARQKAREDHWKAQRRAEAKRPLSERGVGRVPAERRARMPEPVVLVSPELGRVKSGPRSTVVGNRADRRARGQRGYGRLVAKTSMTKEGQMFTYGVAAQPFRRPKALPGQGMTTTRR